MKIKVVQTPRIKIVNPAPPPAELTVYPVGPRGEPGPGVPAGGTAGQVLKKIDGTDYNTQWENEAGASPVVGITEVAFGAPVTGTLTSDPNIVAITNFAGFSTRGYLQAYGVRIGNINAGVTQLQVDNVSGWLGLEISAPGNNAISFINESGTVKGSLGVGHWRFHSGIISTDMGYRVDVAGLKVGPYSTLGLANSYPFEVLWTNGSPMFQVTHTASETNIYENNPLTGVGFRKNIFNQTAGLYYAGGFNIGNTLQIGQQNSLATISLVQDFSGGYVADIYYNARYHKFTGTVSLEGTSYFRVYASSNNEIEFYNPDNNHTANIFYITPNRSMTIGVHSGSIEFTTDNYANYILGLYQTSVFIRKGLTIAASIASLASLNIPAGVAPSSPNNGDIWFDGTDLKMRIAGSTKVFFDVVNETPSGLINGSNATFTTAFNFDPGTEEVYLNGLKLVKLEDYNTTGNNQIDLYVSPGVGEHLIVNYKKI